MFLALLSMISKYIFSTLGKTKPMSKNKQKLKEKPQKVQPKSNKKKQGHWKGLLNLMKTGLLVWYLKFSQMYLSFLKSKMLGELLIPKPQNCKPQLLSLFTMKILNPATFSKIWQICMYQRNTYVEHSYFFNSYITYSPLETIYLV